MFFYIKKNKLNIFLLIIITIIYCLYLSIIVIPYGAKYDILTDENTLPAQGQMPEYIMLSYPTYLIYVLISFAICMKINFGNYIQCYTRKLNAPYYRGAFNFLYS